MIREIHSSVPRNVKLEVEVEEFFGQILCPSIAYVFKVKLSDT